MWLWWLGLSLAATEVTLGSRLSPPLTKVVRVECTGDQGDVGLGLSLPVTVVVRVEPAGDLGNVRVRVELTGDRGG